MLVDAKTAAQRLGLQPSTWRERVLGKLFPPPIRRGRRYSRWLESEIAEIERALIRGASDAELRELARELVMKREALSAPPTQVA